jgi:uncharacterized membrane protein YedE/YeeE
VSAVDFAAAAPPRIALAAPAARARPYASPYLAGVGIGLVLLMAYATVGRGLGASGAFTSVAAAGVAAFAPEQAAASPVLGEYVGGTHGPLADWLVVELIGVALGGYLSARLAGRRRRAVEHGPRVSDRARLMYGFGGGAVMGIGAKLARGCTSGQALTGGALLSVGSWIFIATAFAAAYAAAPLFRREWT